MAEIRVAVAAQEFSVSLQTVYECLKKGGFTIEEKSSFKLSEDMYQCLVANYGLPTHKSSTESDKPKLQSGLKKKTDLLKEKALISKKEELKEEPKSEEPVKVETPVMEDKKEPEVVVEQLKETKEIVEEKSVEGKIELDGLKVKGKIDLTPKAKSKSKTSKKASEVSAEKVKSEEVSVEIKPIEPPKKIEETIEEVEERELVKAQLVELDGLTIKGKIELPQEPIIKPKEHNKEKRKRKTSAIKVNIQQEIKDNRPRFAPKFEPKKEIDQKEVQKELKNTLNKIGATGRGKTIKSKFKKLKRESHSQLRQDELERLEQEEKILKVTEFVTANDLANLMNIQVTDVISTCFSLGIMVSINQRLDAETIILVADEYGYDVNFVDAETTVAIEEEEDNEADLVKRPPIVTVMGHVDHGKTSLLDYIRKANVIAGEAGGITQHIGAYEVTLPNKEKITFLDTPGHEAFTAMRARGAKVTDIVVIVIAADDSLMPQTREAISHAQAAGVPMVFAINKIDKEGAKPDKIREELAAMNILVTDWGGTHECQEISAKKGLNIDALLDKILLVSEILELKANPNKRAKGTIIEARLDKGRGIVANVLVQSGTLRVGDFLVAGSHYAKVKALFNERNLKVEQAGPASPVSMLGFSEAPSAGDLLNVLPTEEEAKELAGKRAQLMREQDIRTTKHITLDEIGRRLAVGNFKELNIIVKADVTGSVEALSDSLLNLGNEEVKVNVILKGVGQITESDVLLASASDAIIIGFQVRPSSGAKKLAETEQIDIRHYSIIYQAIDEIKSAIEGMLSPEIKENIIGGVEVREVFKITKVGTIAGCMVTEGKVTRNSKLRLIRDGVVMHQGEIAALKRFKDDVKDVVKGFECGISIKNYSDIAVGDMLEIFEEISIARKLN